MTSIATAMHILCFAAFRYCAIFYPIAYKQLKLKTVKVKIFLFDTCHVCNNEKFKTSIILPSVDICKPFLNFSKQIILLVIWVASLLFGFIPISIWFSSRIRDRTSNLPDARWPSCTLKIE